MVAALLGLLFPSLVHAFASIPLYPSAPRGVLVPLRLERGALTPVELQSPRDAAAIVGLFFCSRSPGPGTAVWALVQSRQGASPDRVLLQTGGTSRGDPHRPSLGQVSRPFQLAMGE